eukprot:CAMPEP_0174367292 /NCGR_PEP_ID=MMETSP0811_2-20130205/84735_1 /TAXON_ID=73025 ORGANISM="Eutreptiella gymnastica-like, Strain CCMP1594" /NCGR_SAMPLE_ID=MMETSP0811_2 /ASSEMBLY_ACC=CAM_ASM_000667 /LENGTH=36 /DNA_ID= /DNA_START= /DNA_END= /DNA_ORIENTATION=
MACKFEANSASDPDLVDDAHVPATLAVPLPAHDAAR